MAENLGCRLTTIAITATAISTAAATATAAATITAATTAARRTLFTRTRLIDGQRAALKLLPMELGNGRVGFGLRPHFDECETTRTASRAILHDVYCDDSACGGKIILQIIFRGTKREIPHEQFGRH